MPRPLVEYATASIQVEELSSPICHYWCTSKGWLEDELESLHPQQSTHYFGIATEVPGTPGLPIGFPKVVSHNFGPIRDHLG